jgi:phage tail protein X
VYAILTANAALADTGALFNSDRRHDRRRPRQLHELGHGDQRRVARRRAASDAPAEGPAERGAEPHAAFLIVPATQEHLAYQYTSAQLRAGDGATINEFRAGGRTALEPIVEAILDANSATPGTWPRTPAQIDTVEYCYLDGAEGPVIESEMGFEVDGISYKCRLDFAAKAIDFRGLYKNAGA